MKIRFLLALLVLAVLSPHRLSAATKGKPKADDDPPSAKLERLLEPCLDAILAPLEKDPKMPRVEVEKLRSAFAGGQVKAKTPAQQQIYQNAMSVCASLTTAMDDRAKAKSEALASAKLPSIMNGSGINKSSPMRGWDAGRNAEAIRKKQADERKYADKMGKEQSAFVESVAYKAWTEKSARLRQSVMALYTRQIQLEAFDERNTEAKEAAAPPPATKPAPAEKKPAPAVAAKPAEKGDPAVERPYLGKWKAKFSGKTYIINEDHTAIRPAEGSEGEVKGTWELTPKGVFVIAIEGLTNASHYKLSDDGKAMQAVGSTAKWSRVNPTDAGVSKTPAPAVAAKPAEKGDPAVERPYLGKWKGSSGKTYLVNEDHTLVRLAEGSEGEGKGTWELTPKGVFVIAIEGIPKSTHYKLTDDGKSLQCTSSTTRWDRVNPTEAGAAATPVVASVPSAERPEEKGATAKDAAYVGTWASPNGAVTFLIKDDHTGVRTKTDGEKVNGKWKVEADGDFHILWPEEHTHFKGKLSEDGQTIQSTLSNNGHWTRKP